MWRLLLGAMLFFPTMAWGHDLKVLASKMHTPKSGQKSTVFFSWGHALPVDELVDAKTIDRFEVHAPSGKILPLSVEGVSLQARVIVMEEAGTYQILALRKPSVLTYIIDEGGNKVMRRGPKSSITGAKIDSSMRSVQSARAILVSGGTGKAVEPMGIDLEIVPHGLPQEWKTGADLPMKVLHRGKGVSGAKVEATFVGHRPAEAWPFVSKTGEEGRFVFRATQAGTWVLRVRHQEPSADKDIDFQSYTTTLSLEIP